MLRVSVALALAASVAIISACGGDSRASREEAEVRSVFRSVAVEGRAHEFARICRSEISGLVHQVMYLVAAKCPRVLEEEWAEGVQLTGVGADTRIVVKGNTALVFDGTFDGAAPDRAQRLHGQWVLAELPRNKRHRMTGEARRVAEEINRGALTRGGIRINLETGTLERV